MKEKIKHLIFEHGLSDNKHGVANFSSNLLNLIEEQNLITINSKDCFGIITRIKNKTVRRFMYILWLNSFYLLYLLFQQKPAILLCTNYNIPLIKIPGIKYISVIHDIITYVCPENFTKMQNIYSKFVIKNAIRLADYIVVVSQSVKNELIKELGVDEQRIKVLYNMSNLDFENTIESDSIFKKHNLQPQKYILSVAFMNRRKNISSLIKAYSIFSEKFPDIKLVLVGGFENDKELIANLSSNNVDTEKIIVTGFIENEDLIKLYKNALMYVFPSVYEGFGIPIIEAQSARTPVLASDIPVFREIANDGALFCEPSVEGIALGLTKLAEDEKLREKLIQKGTENIKRFSKEIITEQLLGILNIKTD